MRNIAHGNGSAPRNKQPKMTRVFSLPNKQPYQITHVKKLLKKYATGKVIDLFPFPYQRDALEHLQDHKIDSIDCITFDPPYSNNQLEKHYGGKGIAMVPTNRKYFGKLYKEIKRTIRPGGYLISLGWNSKRVAGFEIIEIILINHGTMHNDTIVTVQQKINHSLLSFT